MATTTTTTTMTTTPGFVPRYGYCLRNTEDPDKIERVLWSAPLTTAFVQFPLPQPEWKAEKGTTIWAFVQGLDCLDGVMHKNVSFGYGFVEDAHQTSRKLVSDWQRRLGDADVRTGNTLAAINTAKVCGSWNYHRMSFMDDRDHKTLHRDTTKAPVFLNMNLDRNVWLQTMGEVLYKIPKADLEWCHLRPTVLLDGGFPKSKHTYSTVTFLIWGWKVETPRGQEEAMMQRINDAGSQFPNGYPVSFGFRRNTGWIMVAVRYQFVGPHETTDVQAFVEHLRTDHPQFAEAEIEMIRKRIENCKGLPENLVNTVMATDPRVWVSSTPADPMAHIHCVLAGTLGSLRRMQECERGDHDSSSCAQQ